MSLFWTQSGDFLYIYKILYDTLVTVVSSWMVNFVYKIIVYTLSLA